MADVNFENITNEMRKIYITNLEINSVYRVYVTHINNPHDFYVMLCRYKRFMTKLEQPGNQLETENIRRGAIVSFESKIKQRWVRGEVFNINETDGTCDLRAIDYGFLEASVPLSGIFTPSEDVALPALAVNCQVIECFPTGAKSWNPEAIQYMKDYVGENLAQIVIKGQMGNKYLVVLNNFTNPGVGVEMTLLGLSQLCCSLNSISKISHPKPEKHYFNFKQVKVGDHLKVRAVTGKTLEGFYVAEVGDYHRQMQEKGYFRHWAKQCRLFPKEKLSEGAAVCVFDGYHNSYERALVKKILENNKVLVHYVDNGVEKSVSIQDLKEMTEKFFRDTAVSIYCAAQQDQRSDFRLQKYLYPGYQFTIKIVELGHKLDKPHIVKLCK